jgi:glyoxylase-like metal-dependent hydrolase (beta-lactamase superfamily II)|nr:MBL fold metallo-hydrolase [Neorhizobium tomejilense]
MKTKALRSKLYVAGHCLNVAAATFRSDPWKLARYPAICAVIEHPDIGHIVFDTGYSSAFAAATRRLPYSLYRMATPVRLAHGESLAEQLAADGIRAAEVDTVVISHFHADHVGGLADFPSATIIADTGGFAAIREKRGFAAVRQGFIPSLIPQDFDRRHRAVTHRRQVKLGRGAAPFRVGYDLLGDGSLVAVFLHGHAFGQIGLMFEDERHGSTFLCADAAWSRRAIRENVGPGALGYMAIDDRPAADNTLARLHELHVSNPEVRIVPSHCPEVWAEIQAGKA